MDKIEVTQAIEWARMVASSKPPRYTDASRNAARYILSHTPQSVEPVATHVAALVEALKVIQRETTAVTPDLENLELCVGTIHSYVTRILAPFTKGQS